MQPGLYTSDKHSLITKWFEEQTNENGTEKWTEDQKQIMRNTYKDTIHELSLVWYATRSEHTIEQAYSVALAQEFEAVQQLPRQKSRTDNLDQEPMLVERCSDTKERGCHQALCQKVVTVFTSCLLCADSCSL